MNSAANNQTTNEYGVRALLQLSTSLARNNPEPYFQWQVDRRDSEGEVYQGLQKVRLAGLIQFDSNFYRETVTFTVTLTERGKGLARRIQEKVVEMIAAEF